MRDQQFHVSRISCGNIHNAAIVEDLSDDSEVISSVEKDELSSSVNINLSE